MRRSVYLGETVRSRPSKFRATRRRLEIFGEVEGARVRENGGDAPG